MIEVLKEVESMIKNDTELKMLFNAEDNRQFLYLGVSPNEVIFPAIVLDFRHVGTLNPVVDELEITLDIFDRNYSIATILKVVERIEKLLLNYQPSNPENNRIFSIKRNYGTLVPDSELEIQHYALSFSIYFSRNELVN